jgi:ubiquinone/menaquinone biosynthesis C-methylase UbiE
MSKTDAGAQIEDWSGDAGRNWLNHLARYESMIAPIGEALLARADFRPGQHVIDIGCGGGATTIAIARAVMPGGSATGLDISEDLIRACGVRASQDKLDDLCFVCADAATASVPGAPFDRLFSRFGSMFFADAQAGFRNMRRMVKDGGRIDLAVWAPPEQHHWVGTLSAVIARHVTPAPRDPRAPGPFALADQAYLRDILSQADFGEIAMEACERMLPVGGAGASPEDGAQMLSQTMSIGQAIQAAGAEERDAIMADLVATLAEHHVPGQGNMLGGKAWLVTAKAI